MIRTLAYGTVREGPRKIIHVVRVLDDIIEYQEIVEIAERMCARALSKYGEQSPAVVVIQGSSKETLQHSESRWPYPAFEPQCSTRH